MHLLKLSELVYLGFVNFTENCNSIKRNFFNKQNFLIQDFLLLSNISSNCSLDIEDSSSCPHTPGWALSKVRPSFPFLSPLHSLSHSSHPQSRYNVTKFIDSSLTFQQGWRTLLLSLRECAHRDSHITNPPGSLLLLKTSKTSTYLEISWDPQTAESAWCTVPP